MRYSKGRLELCVLVALATRWAYKLFRQRSRLAISVSSMWSGDRKTGFDSEEVLPAVPLKDVVHHSAKPTWCFRNADGSRTPYSLDIITKVEMAYQKYRLGDAHFGQTRLWIRHDGRSIYAFFHFPSMRQGVMEVSDGHGEAECPATDFTEITRDERSPNQWLWKADNGGWHTFVDRANQAIETAFFSCVNKLVIEFGVSKYEIDLSVMTQRNLRNGTVRDLSRCPRSMDKLNYDGKSELLQFCREASIKFVKVGALKDIFSRYGRFPKHQDLLRERPDVFAEPDVCTPLTVVSHPWLDPQNADPAGDQLRILVNLVERAEEFAKGRNVETLLMGATAPEHAEAARRFLDSVLFFDWVSLAQKPRSDAQEHTFRRALMNMEGLYASNQTTVIRLDGTLPPGVASPTEYKRRGWCFFEQEASKMKDKASQSTSVGDPNAFERMLVAGLVAANQASIIRHDWRAPPGGEEANPPVYRARGWSHFEFKPFTVSMLKDKASDSSSVEDIRQEMANIPVRSPNSCEPPAELPLCPRDFCDELEQRHFTNMTTDMSHVAAMYTRLFNEKVMTAHAVSYGQVTLPQQANDLCRTLRFARQLRSLKIDGLPVGGEAELILSDFIKSREHLPHLETFMCGPEAGARRGHWPHLERAMAARGLELQHLLEFQPLETKDASNVLPLSEKVEGAADEASKIEEVD